MTSVGPLASSVPHSIVDTVPKQLSVSPSYGLSVFGKSSFLRHTWVRTSLQTLAEASMAFRVTPILLSSSGHQLLSWPASHSPNLSCSHRYNSYVINYPDMITAETSPQTDRERKRGRQNHSLQRMSSCTVVGEARREEP